jgi:hypothetical protein
MNYAIVILSAIFLFAASYWYAAGRRYYHGPRVTAYLIHGVAVGDVKQ